MEGFNRPKAKQDVDSTRFGGATMLQMILCMHSRGKQHKDVIVWEAAPWP
jgi:hypothetical protein